MGKGAEELKMTQTIALVTSNRNGRMLELFMVHVAEAIRRNSVEIEVSPDE